MANAAICTNPILGKVFQRPRIEDLAMGVARRLGFEMGARRGMKVRSSVKKLCEGCKVRSSSLLLLFTVPLHV